MKKYHLAILFSFFSSIGFSQDLSLMTYNIRYATVNDGENQWEKRKEFLVDQIIFYAPDVFGIQEGLKNQIDFIQNSISTYTYIGVGRDDGKVKGEFCAIFFNNKKLELLSENTFWLSPTPDEISKGWDAALERVCTYALFIDKKSGHKFWVFNTHFDHVGTLAREKSAELIVKKVNEMNKDKFPVFVMGDLNLNETSKAIRYLASVFNDSKSVSKEKPFGPHGTFTGFEFHKPVKDRIDYIFCSRSDIIVKKYGVLTDSKESRYPSDHFPVLINVGLTKVDK